MIDIGTDLSEKINKELEKKIAGNTEVRKIYSKVKSKAGTQEDVIKLSQILGDLASNVLISNLTIDKLPNGKMYWNIAEKTIKPVMQSIHKIVNSVAGEVLSMERKKQGIGIKPEEALFPEERINSLIAQIVRTFDDEDIDETE